MRTLKSRRRVFLTALTVRHIHVDPRVQNATKLIAFHAPFAPAMAFPTNWITWSPRNTRLPAIRTTRQALFSARHPLSHTRIQYVLAVHV